VKPEETSWRAAPAGVHGPALVGGKTIMSTLPVVEEILRETGVPMSVREIVERAGSRLPTKSKTPDTVVARDLSMDIKRKGEGSTFIRTAPGRYTMRVFVVSRDDNREVAGNGRPAQPVAAASPSDGAGAEVGEAATPMTSAVRKERAAPLPSRKPSEPTATDSVPVENR
jgi:hypothetical protein